MSDPRASDRRIRDPLAQGLRAPADRARLFLLATVICVGLGSTAGCTRAAPSVHTAELSTAPFAQYLTFSFDVDEAPGIHPSRHAVAARKQARSSITSVLVDKGYLLVEGQSDIHVIYGMGRRSVAAVRIAHRSEWLDENEGEDFAAGALVVDLFDGSSGGQIWHGASRGAIDADRIDLRVLDQAVRDVLAPYPSARRGPEIIAGSMM